MRVWRFVNVGNIRLSKKGACDKLFPELSLSGLSKPRLNASSASWSVSTRQRSTTRSR